MPVEVKVREVDGRKAVARLRRRIRTYERRYEVGSEQMANLVTTGYVKETAEILKWMFDYRVLQSLGKETRTRGTALDSYVHIHETRLEQHPFVDPVRTNTLVIEIHAWTNAQTTSLMQGQVSSASA